MTKRMTEKCLINGEEVDIDKNICDIVIEINKITPTYDCCGGHITGKQIDEPYIKFKANACVEQAFRKAGFRIKGKQAPLARFLDYKSDSPSKEIHKAWSIVRKELKKCHEGQYEKQ
jgi:hypothetical protein